MLTFLKWFEKYFQVLRLRIDSKTILKYLGCAHLILTMMLTKILTSKFFFAFFKFFLHFSILSVGSDWNSLQCFFSWQHPKPGTILPLVDYAWDWFQLKKCPSTYFHFDRWPIKQNLWDSWRFYLKKYQEYSSFLKVFKESSSFSKNFPESWRVLSGETRFLKILKET